MMTMTADSLSPRRRTVPLRFRAYALGGIAWNLFGLAQFAGSLRATPESLIASGLTAEQAAVMTGYPIWMTLAFGIGTFAGLAGSALLLAARREAVPVLALSLAAYIALYVGDITEGVFAAMGMPQIAVLSLVVLIAAGLLHAALRLRARPVSG